MSAVIVRQAKGFGFQDFLLVFSIVCKSFSLWISKNPWVKEDEAVQEVVVRFCGSEVKTGFEFKPCMEGAFNPN